MTWLVTTSQSAEQDIEEASDWYEERSTGLGQQLIDDVRALRRRIARNPMQFSEAGLGARKARLRRFPYLLFFKVAGDEVRIVGCFHERRNPRRWRARVR